MSLTDDINDLPANPQDVMPGHLNHHATIHTALKEHDARLGELDLDKWFRRYINSGENINGIDTYGYYWVNAQSIAMSLVNAPTDGAAYGPAIITVEPTSLGSVLQEWKVISSSSSATFTRRRTSGGVWTDWIRFDRDSITAEFAKKTDIAALATKSEVTTQVQDASWSKTAIPNDADLNTYITPGVYWVNSQTVAGTLVNRPDYPRTQSPAILEVKATVAGGGWIHQTWTSLNLPSLDSPVLTRRRTSGGVWSEWELENSTPPTPPPTPVVSSSENRPGSGYKVVPLSVTLGNSGVTHLSTSGHYRFPLLWNAPVTRWRMCVTTRRPRQGDLSGTHIRLDAVTIGDHSDQGGFTSTPILVASNVDVPEDGSVVKLPWVTGQIGDNVERLLGVKYTSLNDVGPLSLNGECYDMGTADPTDPSATGVKKGSGPLDIWIEAETYATTPTFAAIGDSTSCGAGATRSTNDGWINVWARQIGALPIHYANSGDTAQSWAGSVGGYKQTRWLDLAPPDAVIFALGNNDFSGTASLADMQSRISAMMPDMLNISPNLYAATTKPRAEGKISEEQVQRRVEYNTWLMSENTIFRDVFDWATAVGGDYLEPTYDSGDGIHLNTSGYLQLTYAMRPVTTPSLYSLYHPN